MPKYLYHFTRTAIAHEYIEAPDLETASAEAETRLRSGFKVVTSHGPAQLIDKINPATEGSVPHQLLTAEEYKQIIGRERTSWR